jgi:hypothetical protein
MQSAAGTATMIGNRPRPCRTAERIGSAKCGMVVVFEACVDMAIALCWMKRRRRKGPSWPGLWRPTWVRGGGEGELLSGLDDVAA